MNIRRVRVFVFRTSCYLASMKVKGGQAIIIDSIQMVRNASTRADRSVLPYVHPTLIPDLRWPA